ncbi:hypothetical protein [Cellulomonas sp.]|uniref:hypothetical protein n=1 Tax=Cellulomonas sp. TaxID=40001 RepID=UPI002D556A68|nr:hypothetical protein [Cellulomonas sp.]HYQ76959.1 hypothetical protein [Cellulomonas sp.]
MVAGAVATQAAPALGTTEWLAEFLLSPGPAALAAVLAAVVGFGATRARIRAERAAAEDALRGAARAAALARRGQVVDRDLAQWWAVYRWVAERDPGPAAASRAAVLTALAAATRDPVRSALVTLAWERGRTSEERCDDA